MCPICGAEAWDPFRAYEYRRADPQPDLSEYELLRRRVLFEVWFPASETVTLRAVECRECGFVSYSPRPSSEDVEAKYRFLQGLERCVGPSAPVSNSHAADRRRADEIFRAVFRALGRTDIAVLDFGGGDGKLLEPFVEAGARCSLVDYDPNPLPGVAKIGDTLDDVPEDRRFDVIICSHVLEHLADPASVLSALRRRLDPGGVIYGEVPVEVWRGIPIARDPVTHVNFFTLPPFVRLFTGNGFDISEFEERSGTYGGVPMDVAIVVATPANAGGPQPPAPEIKQSRRRIHPTPAMELARLWRRRRLIPSAVRRRIRVRLRR